MRSYFTGGMYGANVAAIVAGLSHNMERAIGWMIVCALFGVALAIERWRS